MIRSPVNLNVKAIRIRSLHAVKDSGKRESKGGSWIQKGNTYLITTVSGNSQVRMTSLSISLQTTNKLEKNMNACIFVFY